MTVLNVQFVVKDVNSNDDVVEVVVVVKDRGNMKSKLNNVVVRVVVEVVIW